MHYPQYLLEREGLSTLETEVGFLTYKFRGSDCYIQDIYVLPGYRKSGAASAMADKVVEIARSAGIRILTGSVDFKANGAESSDLVLRAYGFIPYTKEGYVTYYRKEI